MSNKKSNKYEQALPRLQEAVEKLCLTKTEVAKTTGYSKGQAGWIIDGKAAITERFIKVFCSSFHISEQWLLFGVGNMVRYPNREAALSKLHERVRSLIGSRNIFHRLTMFTETGITNDLVREYLRGEDVLSDEQLKEVAENVDFRFKEELFGPYKDSGIDDSNQASVNNNGVIQVGSFNGNANISMSAQSPQIPDDLKDVWALLIKYHNPALIKDLKARLLKIKEATEG